MPKISELNPESYQRIRIALASHGIDESVENISLAFGNAIFKAAVRYFELTGRVIHRSAFEQKFADRSSVDVTAPDQMVEFILRGRRKHAEWLSTLIERLEDVLSRPE